MLVRYTEKFFEWLLPQPLFWILLVSVAFGFLEAKHWRGALQEPGHDRERLRSFLKEGGNLRLGYINLITRALDWLDRFLGDHDKAELSLRLPFGHWPTRPYWTGWSFDKCMLLAMVYPALTMFITWAATGDVGELGSNLGLHAIPRYLGAAALALVLWIMIGAWLANHRESPWSLVWLASVAAASAGAGAIAGSGAVACAVAAAVAVAGSGSPKGAVAVAVALIGVCTGAVIWANASFNVLVVTIAFAVTIAVSLSLLVQWASSRRRLGSLWLILWPLEIAGCYGLLWAANRVDLGDGALLFIVLLALVPLANVPFDWASVGFTRALLRYGCQPNVMSPLWIGLADFAIGLFLVILLALSLICVLHLVDVIVSRAPDGPRLIDVPRRLFDIDRAPFHPANWWVYLTLFSTLVPSAFNLLIGMFSFLTWARPARREKLIEKIDSLKGKGFKTTRGEISLELGIDAALATFVSLIIIYLIGWLLLHTGLIFLSWFLWFAITLESL
jgi:hypothetical protein